MNTFQQTAVKGGYVVASAYEPFTTAEVHEANRLGILSELPAMLERATVIQAWRDGLNVWRMSRDGRNPAASCLIAEHTAGAAA